MCFTGHNMAQTIWCYERLFQTTDPRIKLGFFCSENVVCDVVECCSWLQKVWEACVVKKGSSISRMFQIQTGTILIKTLFTWPCLSQRFWYFPHKGATPPPNNYFQNHPEQLAFPKTRDLDGNVRFRNHVFYRTSNGPYGPKLWEIYPNERTKNQDTHYLFWEMKQPKI